MNNKYRESYIDELAIQQNVVASVEVKPEDTKGVSVLEHKDVDLVGVLVDEMAHVNRVSTQNAFVPGLDVLDLLCAFGNDAELDLPVEP